MSWSSVWDVRGRHECDRFDREDGCYGLNDDPLVNPFEQLEMSDPNRRRRRWPWMILVMAVLLAAGPVAWRYRPLNAVERKLVGTWRTPSMNEYPQFVVLRPDRRLQRLHLRSFSPAGEWSASRSILTHQRVGDLRGSIEWLLGRRPSWRSRMKIAADDAGSLTLTDVELEPITWTRHSDDVPEEPPESVIIERTN